MTLGNKFPMLLSLQGVWWVIIFALLHEVFLSPSDFLGAAFLPYLTWWGLFVAQWFLRWHLIVGWHVPTGLVSDPHIFLILWGFIIQCILHHAPRTTMKQDSSSLCDKWSCTRFWPYWAPSGDKSSTTSMSSTPTHLTHSKAMTCDSSGRMSEVCG